MLNYQKYKRVPVLDYKERQWPDKEIQKAPIWCSVDLRDGNQALIEPMVVEEKLEFFNLLVKLGFKEIEIGFPSASQLEYDFLRTLVDRKLIPDDVRVQILCQCRQHLIDKSFEAIKESRMSYSIFTIPHQPSREMSYSIRIVKPLSRSLLREHRWLKKAQRILTVISGWNIRRKALPGQRWISHWMFARLLKRCGSRQ